MVVMFLLAALGGSIPQADINRICESAKVDSLPEDRVTAMRGCVGDETSARDQLRREWGRYSAADKNNCASTPGMQFSYVELLTCLEMQRGGNFGGGSSLAAPPTRPMTTPATPEPKP
jgi:hypothetical protein